MLKVVLQAALGLVTCMAMTGQAFGQGSREGLIAELAARIATTQLSVDRALDDGRARFQATVLSFRADGLVIMTAAHCAEKAKKGDVFRLAHGKIRWEATVELVARNPAYSERHRGAAGADTAVVRLTVPQGQPGWLEVVESLGAAELSASPGARRGGEAVSVLVVDQDGKARALKGANFRNPRWLEWGRAYSPRGGDSGSGVFVAVPVQGGRPRPVLIGAVTDRDMEGGGGALAWRSERWVADALRKPEAMPPTP